jgi:uncharacterized protein (TIRG00374 family)
VAEARRHDRLRRYSWLIGWALFIGVVIVIVRNWTDEREMVRLAERARPAWLWAALGLQILTYASGAAIWGVTLGRLGVEVPFRDLLALTFAKLFTDSLLPTGGVAGSAVVARALSRRGIPGPKATAVLLVNVLGSYPALALGLAFASILLYATGRFSEVVLTIAVAFVVLALLVPSVLVHFSGPGTGWARRTLRRVPLVKRILVLMAEIPPKDLRDPIALGSAILLELVILILDASTLFVLMRAVGVEAPYLWIATAYVMGQIAGTVSVIPGGFGSFDAVNIAILASFGIGVEAALAGTLLLRGFAQILPMLPGWLITRHEIK